MMCTLQIVSLRCTSVPPAPSWASKNTINGVYVVDFKWLTVKNIPWLLTFQWPNLVSQMYGPSILSPFFYFYFFGRVIICSNPSVLSRTKSLRIPKTKIGQKKCGTFVGGFKDDSVWSRKPSTVVQIPLQTKRPYSTYSMTCWSIFTIPTPHFALVMLFWVWFYFLTRLWYRKAPYSRKGQEPRTAYV